MRHQPSVRHKLRCSTSSNRSDLSRNCRDRKTPKSCNSVPFQPYAIIIRGAGTPPVRIARETLQLPSPPDPSSCVAV